MKSEATDNLRRRADDLARLLDRLAGLHEQMLSVIERRLDAIRAADLDATCACNDEQEVLARRIHEREGMRKQLMDAIGVELGLGAKEGRALTVSQLVRNLPDCLGEQLQTARDRLRGVMGRVAHANRVSGAVSRELASHLRFVFAAVRPASGKSGHYSPNGITKNVGAGVFETIG